MQILFHAPSLALTVIYNRLLSIANIRTSVGAVLQPASVALKIEQKFSTVRPPFRFLARSLPSLAFAAAVLAPLAGCGNSYRPVVTAINPVGPAAQPQKYAVAISQPTPTSPGLLTIVDFSGDTVLVNANLGVAPYYFITDAGGNTGYTLNGDGTVNTFDISNALLANAVQQITLLPGGSPNSVFPTSASLYITEPGRSSVAQFQNSPPPPALKQELPVAANVVYIAGVSGAARIYAISQGALGGLGQVAGIETSTNTVTSTIPVGRTPVYGVMTADGKRAFVMNKGDNTVSVINAQANQLDTPIASIPVGTAPVWADLAPTRAELVVANAGDGVSPGSVSIVNIPLCSASALASNPNCNPNNPVDAVGFGTVLATIPVGINPRVVAVLQDGTQAFVANGGNPNLPCGATAVANVSTTCTISAVNLTTNTVTATIPIAGHPSFLAATTGSPTGKVYVVAQDSTDMTVIRTDTDTIQTTVPLQGNGIQVRVTMP